MIGEIVTQADLKAMAKMNEKSFSQSGFIAPTVYLPANSIYGGWRYYNTIQEAIVTYKYLMNMQGGKNITGTAFKVPKTKDAVTLFVDVDFFFYLPVLGLIPSSYAAIKSQIKNIEFVIIKAKTATTGKIVYAVINLNIANLSATPINNVPGYKIEQLDALHRQVQLLRINYNSFVSHADRLQKKKNLTQFEIQIFGELKELIGRFQIDVKSIEGINIKYAQNKNAIGIYWVAVYWIVGIISASIAAAVIGTSFAKAKEKNDLYNYQEWLLDYRKRVAESLTLTAQQKKDLDDAATAQAAQAAKIIDDKNKPQEGMLDKIQNILIIGGVIYLASKFIK